MKTKILCMLVCLMMLFSLIVSCAENNDVIVSVGSAEYKEYPNTGWGDSSIPDGVSGKITRFNGEAATCEWRPNLKKGVYTVSIYKVQHETGDPETKVEVFHAGGTETKIINYTEGQSEWVTLGVFDFSEGNNGYVKATRGKAVLRTGSVKFTAASGGNGGSKADLFTDASDSKYKNAIELVSQLSLLQGKSAGNFAPLDNLTRAEAAVILLRCLGFTNKISNTATEFSDVSASHWASGYIDMAVKSKLVSGLGGGIFAPDSKITYNQFIKMMVSLLGYEYRAVPKGGYPSGYVITGNDIGLTKGVSVNGEEAITRGEAAKILYNACNIDIMEPQYIGEETQYISYEGVSFVTKYLKLKKVEGKIKATSFAALDENVNLRVGEVQIEGSVYKEGAVNTINLLGFDVTAFVTDEAVTGESAKIVAITENQSKNKSLVINSNDITSDTTVTNLVYYTNEDHEKMTNVKIDTKADLIYNGRTKFGFSKLDLLPKNGTVTLIDNDGNSVYDVVIVKNYYNLVVKSVNKTESIITFKYQNQIGSLSLDEKDGEIRYSFTESTGLKADIYALKEWDVLSVAVSSDQKRIEAIVGRQKVQNEISEIYDTEDGREVVIDGESYKVSDSLEELIRLSKIKDFELGTAGIFYLNYKGEIVACNYDLSVSHGYGYLVNASIGKNLEQTIRFKIFTEKGTWVEQDLADKVKMGNSVLTSNELKTLVNNMTVGGQFTRQLITYKLNAKKQISEINLAVNGKSYDEFSLNYGGLLFYRMGSKIMGTQYLIGEQTKIFYVPPASKSDDETLYRMETANSFRTDAEYDVKVYDQNINMVIGALVYEDLGKINHLSPIGIVEKVTEGMDSNGDIVTMAYMIVGGKSSVYITDNKAMSVDMTTTLKKLSGNETLTISQLNKGDIVQIIASGSKINNIRSLLLVNNREIFERQSQSGTEIATEMNYSNELYYGYGTVEDFITNGVKFKTRNEWLRAILFGGAQCYLMDTKSNTINPIKYDEIMISDHIFIQSINYASKIIVVYR